MAGLPSTTRSSRMTARILSRWDLPEPKKPLIHAPLPTASGSLYSSKNSSRCRSTSFVTTNSSSSLARYLSSSARTTGSIARKMSFWKVSWMSIACASYRSKTLVAR